MKSKTKQYSKLPFKFIEAIQLFTRAEIIIYSILCVRANKEKKTWPGVKSLMKDAGVTKPTVTTALKRLQKYGFLELVTRRHHNTSVYRITEPEDMSSVFEELERKGGAHFEWQHDYYEESEKSKSNGFGLDSDEDTNQEIVKVKSSEGASKTQQESKQNSEEVKVRSNVAVTTLTRTNLNRSTLKDLIGKFNLNFLSDNRLEKDSSLISSEANASVAKPRKSKGEIPIYGNSSRDEIIDIAKKFLNPVDDIRESSNTGADNILESSEAAGTSQPVAPDEVSSGTDSVTDHTKKTMNKRNLAPETINQRIMLQKFGLDEFPTYAEKSTFMKFEKRHGDQALEDLILKAYGTASTFREAMMNLRGLIY